MPDSAEWPELLNRAIEFAEADRLAKESPKELDEALAGTDVIVEGIQERNGERLRILAGAHNKRSLAIFRMLNYAERDSAGKIDPAKLDRLQQAILVGNHQITSLALDHAPRSQIHALTAEVMDAVDRWWSTNKTIDTKFKEAYLELAPVDQERADRVRHCGKHWSDVGWSAMREEAIGLNFPWLTRDQANGRFLSGFEDREQLTETIAQLQASITHARAVNTRWTSLPERVQQRVQEDPTLSNRTPGHIRDRFGPRPAGPEGGKVRRHATQGWELEHDWAKGFPFTAVAALGEASLGAWAAARRKVMPRPREAYHDQFVGALHRANRSGMVELSPDVIKVVGKIADRLPDEALRNAASTAVALAEAGKQLRARIPDYSEETKRNYPLLTREPARVLSSFSQAMRDHICSIVDTPTNPVAIVRFTRQASARQVHADTFTAFYRPEVPLKDQKKLEERLGTYENSVFAAAGSRQQRLTEKVHKIDRAIDSGAVPDRHGGRWKQAVRANWGELEDFRRNREIGQ